MYSRRDATDAMDRLQRFEMDGRELTIVFAKDRRKTPDEMRPRDSRGGDSRGDSRDRGGRRNASRSRSRDRGGDRDRDYGGGRGGGGRDDRYADRYVCVLREIACYDLCANHVVECQCYRREEHLLLLLTDLQVVVARHLHAEESHALAALPQLTAKLLFAEEDGQDRKRRG
jgi:hypothetical protein